MLRRGELLNRFTYTRHNEVSFVPGGTPYFQKMKEVIEAAHEHIHLQCYILDYDDTGRMVIEWLRQAAARGVKVYVLVDGYATVDLPQNLVASLFAEGIIFRWFEPLIMTRHFYYGRRMHRKVLVSDATYALVGGINISNRYNDMPGQPAWLDCALYVAGEAAADLYSTCVRIFAKGGWPAWQHMQLPEQETPRFLPQTQCLVRVLRNDWVHLRREVTQSYLAMFATAKHEVFAMSSYFLPGRKLRQAMAKASARGVRIHVVIAGNSDVPVAKHAERYLYRWLLRHHIHLYEYTDKVLHAKVCTADKRWVTLGSYNLNNVSEKASIELNLDVQDSTLSNEVTAYIQNIIQQSGIEITSDYVSRQYGIGSRLLQWCSYRIYRLVLYLFTFYFKPGTI
jgi:cardiolipin synthase